MRCYCEPHSGDLHVRLIPTDVGQKAYGISTHIRIAIKNVLALPHCCQRFQSIMISREYRSKLIHREIPIREKVAPYTIRWLETLQGIPSICKILFEKVSKRSVIRCSKATPISITHRTSTNVDSQVSYFLIAHDR